MLHTHLIRRGADTYIILHDDERRLAALMVAWRWANNRELSFTLSDFAEVGLRILGKSEVECEGR